MNPELFALTFGGLSALSWGSGDFNGALATRRMGVVSALTLVHGVGLVFVTAMALLTREAFPPLNDLLLNMGAGLIGLLAIMALYQALAHGRMGIAAPVSAVLNTLIPVVYSVIFQRAPSPQEVLGFGVALAAVVLVSMSSSHVEGVSGLGMAVLAGVGFGAFFIVVDFITSESVFWLAAASRLFTFSLMLLVVVRLRRSLRPTNGVTILILLLAGVLDVLGNVFFLVATQSGRLDIAAVVVSLYPAVTILLARLLLHERLNRLQGLGAVLALLAVVLLAL